MNTFPGRVPYTGFTSFLVSRLMLAIITLFLQTLAFYHVNECKNTSTWTTAEGSRITFLKIGLWTLRVGPNSYWYRFYSIRLHRVCHFVFATPVRRSFDTPGYRGQCCWATQRGLIAFMSAYRDAMTKSIDSNTSQNKTKNERDCMRGNENLVKNFPKIVKYKSPSRSKLNNLTG